MKRIAFLLLLPQMLVSQTTPRVNTLDIPMRDGQTLAADLYAVDSGAAKPVILIQTPYNRLLYRVGLAGRGGPSFPYDTSKYNYVIVDWRGFYGSKDADVPGYDRGLDGYDAVEWIAGQNWCNGRVGTWGPSALGAIQFLTARRHPPHLVCCAPLVKDFKTKYGDYFYGGVFRREHVESMERLGFLTVDAVLSQPMYNAFWRAVERSGDYADSIAVPMLLISGWFDHYPDDVLRAFTDLRTRSDASVRDRHKLIMGPWTHGGVGAEKQGELSFPGAVSEAREAALQFFGYYLWNEKNGYPLRPVMRYFQMGEDVWKSTVDWAAEGKDSTVLYLNGPDLLSPTAPSAERDSTALLFDPRNPSPSHGGARFNPFDPSVIPGPLDISGVVENRSDALTFSTPPLENGLAIAGPVRAELFMSSDRTDTDVSVRLCDVYPDGRSMIMADGIARARHRNGLDSQSPLVPGRTALIEVYLQNLALTIQKSHRLRIVVACSNYPRFDVNPNSGGPVNQPGDTLLARNVFYFDAQRPSRIALRGPGTSSADRAQVPSEVHIGPNYPNPFRERTGIPVSFGAQAGDVCAAVFDALGRKIAALYEGPGRDAPALLDFDAKGLPGGIYVCRIASARGIASLRLLLAP